MHDERRKDFAAVRARATLFQSGHPRAGLAAPHPDARETRCLAALGVITPVVRAAAVAAVGKLAGSRPMELALRLGLPALRAGVKDVVWVVGSYAALSVHISP